MNVTTVVQKKIFSCNKTHLDSMMDDQTIVCTQLLAGHMVGTWPMKSASNDNCFFVCSYQQISAVS